ncbi:MAG: CgeB family protein [Chloroflexota bacterium]
MRLLVFGLSITSSWGNGHATVYRGLLKELHRLGLEVTFVEKDVPWYAANRDLPWADFSRILLYQGVGELEELLAAELPRCDAVLMGSYFPDGVIVADGLMRRPEVARLYYDIDTPVTLAAFASRGAAPYLRADQVGAFDSVLSFTGGRALVELEERWGARRAVAFYCALDPDTHRRVAAEEPFRCRLGYMGTYSADRQEAWESLFLRPSLRLPEQRFVLAGPQYPDMGLPPNVSHYHHLPPSHHAAFYSSCDLSLNITRGPMVAYGYSPSVRLFEAAGCAGCVVSDRWDGLGGLFEVGREILVADDEDAMVDLLQRLPPDAAVEIGERLRARVLREHTYEVRARQFLDLLERL